MNLFNRVEKLDKRDRAKLFRTRLREAMIAKGLNQSGLARAVGVDRSTVSQLLSGEAVRLPNAQVVAECASAMGVAGDWLLGLSDRQEQAADLLAASMEVSDAPRALIDEQIFGWHVEAAGYKIRHVPAALPDMLKTESFVRWEYAPHLGRTTDQVVGASRDRLEWMKGLNSDYEIAMPLFEIEALATSTGYYRGLPPEVREEQIAYLLELHEALYPSLRVFLFDARRLWSAPMTVFGPLIGVLYLGQHYIAFRDRERVRLLTAQFDTLVREAYISARNWPEHVQALAASS